MSSFFIWSGALATLYAVVAVPYGFYLKPISGENPKVIEQNHYGSGDNVAGDKYELANPTEFRPLITEVQDELIRRIHTFKEANKNTELHILFQFFTTDEGTKKFAYEFKKLMGSLGIHVHVVPIQLVGGPSNSSGIHIKFKKLIYEDIILFIKCVEVLFSAKNGQIVIPKPREVEDIGDFNILIRVVKQTYFDSDGRVYFSK